MGGGALQSSPSAAAMLITDKITILMARAHEEQTINSQLARQDCRTFS
jgi:hypothetical protein